MASRSEEAIQEGTAETMNPLDMAMSVLKASAARQISTAPGTIWENYRSKTAHPSISDERLADAHLSTEASGMPTEFDEDDYSWDARGGKRIPLAERAQMENRNAAKNSLLTRVKQLPKRFAQDMRVSDALDLQVRPMVAQGDEVGAERHLNEVIARRERQKNEMSWADANRANEQAQGAMQPVPQPPPLQQPVPQGVNQP